MYFFKRTPGVLWLYFFKAGVKPNDSKINALKNVEWPQEIKGICSYLGLVNYLKHFILDVNISTTTANVQKH